jgi:hypothetical protein
MPRSRRRLVWYTRFRAMFDIIRNGGGNSMWDIGAYAYNMLSSQRVFRYRWIARSAFESLVLAAVDAGVSVPAEVIQSTDMHGHRFRLRPIPVPCPIPSPSNVNEILRQLDDFTPTFQPPLRRTRPTGPTDDADECR